MGSDAASVYDKLDSDLYARHAAFFARIFYISREKLINGSHRRKSFAKDKRKRIVSLS